MNIKHKIGMLTYLKMKSRWKKLDQYLVLALLPEHNELNSYFDGLLSAIRLR